MNKVTKKAIKDGNEAEATSKTIYNKGESGDYTADIMQAVSPTGVVFDGYFKHNGRKHFPDGYIQIGRTMHIFEMKDGNRSNRRHESQVNRYAHVMNIAMDFDRVITYIIYGSRKEVVIEGYNARDIHIVYEATRMVGDNDYSWTVDYNASMSDADRVKMYERARIVRSERSDEKIASDSKKKRIARVKRMSKRTPEQAADAKKRSRQSAAKIAANRTPEERAAFNKVAATRAANRTPKQVARTKELDRARRANRTPEERAAFNAKAAEKRAIKRAARTPEMVAADKERVSRKFKEKYKNRTSEQKAIDTAKNKIKYKEKTIAPTQEERDVQRTARNKAQRESYAKRKAAANK